MVMDNTCYARYIRVITMQAYQQDLMGRSLRASDKQG